MESKGCLSFSVTRGILDKGQRSVTASTKQQVVGSQVTQEYKTTNRDQQGDASIPTGDLHAIKFPTSLPRLLLIRRPVVGLRHPTGSSSKTS